LTQKVKMKDTIVESVINQFKQRSEVGIKKYNTTLDREDLTFLEWINHAQQEAMDFILYLEKLKQYNI
jgi:succinate dehydrogenase flavin-adding protein (antitoxin of CptAB toxin-antitoxin module)